MTAVLLTYSLTSARIGKAEGNLLESVQDGPIFLITAYAKNEEDSLTKQERNELAKRADEIFARYGR